MRLPVRHEPPEDDAGGEFRRLRDRLFADLERWPQLVEESLRPVLPVTDVQETGEAYHVDVELAGVPADEVSVQVSPGRLVVDGRRRTRGHLGVLLHRNRPTGRLHLELTLPGDVDVDAVDARFADGLLHVRLPKAAAARRRRIAVTHRPDA